jgi:hypothetical protein
MAEEQGQIPQISFVEIRDISIAIDSYDDIFSDFDPREFSKREVSDDLLKELRRRHIEARSGKFEVRFILTADMRDPKLEATIKKRLREHFERRLKELEEELHSRRWRGKMYIAFGALFLLLQAYYTAFIADVLSSELLAIILVPAGWFGMFTGIEKLLEDPDRFGEQKRLNEKLMHANYIFLSEDRE